MSHHFLAQLLATPWAMSPDRINAYAALLAREYAGKLQAQRKGPAPDPEPQAATQRAGNARSGAVAVIEVYGTIMQRASMMNMCDGGTSTQAISQQMRQANADSTISDIVLDIGSPGGGVYGVPELAADIRNSTKRVIAVATSQAGSAAYWLGSAASEFYCTPSGEVGSIGVWMAHEDWSKALAESGMDMTVFSAGKFKIEGNSWGPLSPEAKIFMQSRTDDYYGAFTRDVAKGRKCSVEQVRDGMGQGRMLGATQAKADGMIDGVMTLDQVISHVQRNAKQPSRNAAQQQRQQLALLALA